MAKISRPIIYVAALGAVAYAAVLLTEPDAPAKVTTPRSAKTASSAPKGFTEEDLKASFPRYLSKEKDAFKPRVVSQKRGLPGVVPGGALPGNLSEIAGLEKGVWLLTGVSSVNGVRSALVENGSTGESVFLKPGTVWKGLRVSAVQSDAVVLVNAQGRQTRLAFTQFADEIKAPGAPAGVAPVIIAGPGANVRTPDGQLPVLNGAAPVNPAPAPTPSPAQTNSRPSEPSESTREIPRGTVTADSRSRSVTQP